MKTILPLIALLSAGLCISSSICAASNDGPPVIVKIQSVVRGEANLARIGATESSVRESLGIPSHKISADVWVYYNFRTTLEAAKKHACDTLIVSFKDDRVSSIALTNDRAGKIVAARLRSNPAYLQGPVLARN